MEGRKRGNWRKKQDIEQRMAEEIKGEEAHTHTCTCTVGLNGDLIGVVCT
jgi:hypothetical protein